MPERPPAAEDRQAYFPGLLAAQRRERDQLVRELAKVRGLVPLLMKARNGETWSPEEREALVEQLRALAHMSPYLVLMILPGSFIALPLLAWWLDRRRLRREEPPAT